MNNALMFSSKSDEWATPQDFYQRMRNEFQFYVDLAASEENTKCDHFYSIENSGLAAHWHQDFPGGIGWCNPPYSRGLQGKFIEKSAQERLKGFTTVMLLPARTDTKAFHKHIYDETKWSAREGVEIRLLRGRLKFGGAAASAPFPSMVVVFRP